MDRGYHKSRLLPDIRRDIVWKALWEHYFSKFVPTNGCVLDLGCGYGHFINNVVAERRIAIDCWPEFPRYLEQGVEAIIGSVTNLAKVPDGMVDFAFASNLFEHMPQTDFGKVLAELRKKLSTSGTLVILQPNYRYAYREYFDDYTHIAVYSHVSIADFLVANGYEVITVIRRFMPLSVKSRLPISRMLVRAYLSSPIKLFGKQMLIRAKAGG